MKKDLSVARKRAWGWFSKLVRLEESTGNGYGPCYTCGHIKNIKYEMQAGHCFPRGRWWNAASFDRRNVHSQCIHCNKYLSSNPVKYKTRMIEDYGEAVFDELNILAKQPSPHNYDDFRAMAKEYRKQIKNLGGW